MEIINKTTFCPRGRKVRGSQTSNILAGKGNKQKSYQESIIYLKVQCLCFNCIFFAANVIRICMFPCKLFLWENCNKEE